MVAVVADKLTEFRAHSNTYMYGSDAFSVGVHVRGFKII
jgi:hypothetical protein